MSNASIQGGQGGVPTWAMVASGIIFIFCIMLGIGLYASGQSEQTQPNPNGAEIPQAANPTTPQYTHLSNLLTLFAEPAEYITDNIKALTTAQGQLDTLNQKVQADTTLSAATKKKVADLVSSADGTLSSMQSTGNTASQGTDATFASDERGLTDTVNQLELALQTNGATGLRAAAVAIAIATITSNNGGVADSSGKHPIPFSKAGGDTKTTGMDCSGFMTYIFTQLQSQLKVPLSERITTTELPNDPDFTKVDIGTNNTITPQQIQDAITKGVLKPGDLILSRENTTGETHVVMYLGGAYTGSQSIAESTTMSGGKSGPMYTSVAERFSSHRTNEEVFESKAYAN